MQSPDISLGMPTGLTAGQAGCASTLQVPQSGTASFESVRNIAAAALLVAMLWSRHRIPHPAKKAESDKLPHLTSMLGLNSRMLSSPHRRTKLRGSNAICRQSNAQTSHKHQGLLKLSQAGSLEAGPRQWICDCADQCVLPRKQDWRRLHSMSAPLCAASGRRFSSGRLNPT